VASLGAAESGPCWAERVSRRLLGPLGARWRHTLGVAERARVVGGVLERDEAELLLAAAYLHDVGYAPELAQIGFHPVDGARFVRARGSERLAGLVAYHSGAEAEARERGLVGELSEFEDERSVVSRALTYCDLTTDSAGRLVTPGERLASICVRYGQAAPEARALKRSQRALLGDVRTMEAMLSEKGVTDPALPANQMGGS
jgi:HD domain